jgi:hypothetical protein
VNSRTRKEEICTMSRRVPVRLWQAHHRHAEPMQNLFTICVPCSHLFSTTFAVFFSRNRRSVLCRAFPWMHNIPRGIHNLNGNPSQTHKDFNKIFKSDVCHNLTLI